MSITASASTVVLPQQVILTGTSTPSTVTYAWTQKSGPTGPNGTPGVTFGSAATGKTSVQFTAGAGTYVLTLTATDGQVNGSADVSVTVNPYLYPSPPDWNWPNTAGITTGCSAPSSPTASGWQTVTDPTTVGMNVTTLQNSAVAYAQNEKNAFPANSATLNEAGYVIRYGYLVYCWADGSDGSSNAITDFTRYPMYSSTKSIGGLALALALHDGLLKSDLSDNVSTILPPSGDGAFGSDPPIDTSSAPSGAALNQITVFQLGTHTAGLSKPDSGTRLLSFIPGSTWSYSDQGLNWLADVLTWKYGEDLSSLMNTKVYNPLGIDVNVPGSTNDLDWRKNAYRTNPVTINGNPVQRRELAAGISATVNAMARVGLLMLRNGAWTAPGQTQPQQLIDSAYIKQFTTPPLSSTVTVSSADSAYTNPVANYGILWWTNAGCGMPGVPKDTYFSWGLDETLTVVIPSLDLVIARAGNYPWELPNPTNPQLSDWDGNYARIAPFIQGVVSSVTDYTVGQDCSVQPVP